MKFITYTFTILGILISVWTISACNSTADQAVVYNDAFVEMQGELLMSVENLEGSFEDYQPAKMDSCYRQLMANIQSNKAKLEKIGDFEGDSTLYAAQRSLLDEYDKLVTNEYAELISYLKIPDSLYTVDDQERSFDIMKEVTIRRKAVHSTFINAQKSFGEEYGFVFEDDGAE